MLWDTHLHTRYSGDSTAEPEDMVQAALQHGLDGIGFTDHIEDVYKRQLFSPSSNNSVWQPD